MTSKEGVAWTFRLSKKEMKRLNSGYYNSQIRSKHADYEFYKAQIQDIIFRMKLSSHADSEIINAVNTTAPQVSVKNKLWHKAREHCFKRNNISHRMPVFAGGKSENEGC